jgi:hypothetical protein
MARVCGQHDAIDRVNYLRKRRDQAATTLQALVRGAIRNPPS